MTGSIGERGSPDAPACLLWHPAFVPEAEALRALANLRGEEALLRALAGVLSALAATEAAGREGVPAFSAWGLGADGLPRLAPTPTSATHPLGHHLEGFLRLFGARPGKRDGSPVLPRRHPHAPVLGRWFARWAGRAGGARSALLDLLDALSGEGELPGLPGLWGFSGEWRPRPGLGEGRCAALSPPGEAARGALAIWCAEKGVRRVSYAQVSPFPFASLEPLVRAALGDGRAAREWLSAQLGRPSGLARALSDLLHRSPAGWWLDGPEPDEASRTILREAGEGTGALLLLPDSEGEPAGAFGALRTLTLPETGEGWFLAEALSVCGSEDAVLEAYSEEASPPKPGGALLPPVPAGRAAATPSSDGPAAEVASDSWRHAAHLAAAGQTREAALWRCRAHLATGQAPLALAALAEAPEGAEGALLEARARERLQDLKGMRGSLARAARAEGLARGDAADLRLLLGQSSWLAGEVEAGISRLEEALRLAPDDDSRALAAIGLATARLHTGDLDAASALLRKAEGLLPACRLPRPGVVWAHRTALLLRKRGRYAEAAAGFARAAEAARKVRDRWMEAVARLEAGNALRLQFRFSDAREALRAAEEGFWTLGLPGPRESARFDRMLCDVESGHLLEAQSDLEASVARAAPSRDRAVERYWLARVLAARGEPGAALEQAEAALEEVARFPDPEIEAPLVVLRGRLLLEARELRRLGPALRAVQGVFASAADADDRLDAATLLLEASALPRSPHPSPGPPEQLGALAASATPASRGRWAVALGRAGLREPGEAFDQARALAAESHDLALEAEALCELFRRGALPALAPESAWRIAAYLTENRVRGPLRDLLPALSAAQPQAVREEGGGPEPVPRPLLLLEGARRGELHLGEAARAAGARAAVLHTPGAPAEWWGEAAPALRREMADLAGLEAEADASGHHLAGAAGRGGRRACFAWPGAAPAEGIHLMRVWAALLPPPRLPEAEGESVEDPALSRLLLGTSDGVAALRAKLRGAAPFSFPVLLTGEPGVGKEACARALHELSGKGRRPWVAANCANLSPTLAASLLFGHRRGAFTGADRDSPGLVEAARGGTLFLDEVGELPTETQAQLLRFLQDGSYTPLGESRGRSAEARVVAATNRDLEGAVAGGGFRADLFHRLNVIRVEIPPLRERADDIPLLFRHFLEGAAAGEGRPVPEVEDAVWTRLAAWRWPGNVRELQNLARACLVAAAGKGRIAEADLPAPLLAGRGGGRALRQIRDRSERAAVAQALRKHGGNLTAAARDLGVSRQALAQKRKRLGLDEGTLPLAP